MTWYFDSLDSDTTFDSLDSDTTFDLAFINSYENGDMIGKMNET
jgi:hypothetical protein